MRASKRDNIRKKHVRRCAKELKKEFPCLYNCGKEYATDAARTISGVLATSPTDGAGDGIFVKLMEERNHGTQFGYYLRGHLPNTPVSYAVKTTNYDMWHLAATKDGSSSSQIHGVDNLIDITIANTSGSGVNALQVENLLNAYCGSVGFGPVTL